MSVFCEAISSFSAACAVDGGTLVDLRHDEVHARGRHRDAGRGRHERPPRVDDADDLVAVGVRHHAEVVGGDDLLPHPELWSGMRSPASILRSDFGPLAEAQLLLGVSGRPERRSSDRARSSSRSSFSPNTSVIFSRPAGDSPARPVRRTSPARPEAAPARGLPPWRCSSVATGASSCCDRTARTCAWAYAGLYVGERPRRSANSTTDVPPAVALLGSGATVRAHLDGHAVDESLADLFEDAVADRRAGDAEGGVAAVLALLDAQCAASARAGHDGLAVLPQPQPDLVIHAHEVHVAGVGATEGAGDDDLGAADRLDAMSNGASRTSISRLRLVADDDVGLDDQLEEMSSLTA